MYLYDKNRITYFAETDRRNKRVPFGIKAEDRSRHMYIIGKTGMGKSTLIENMVVQDVKNGEGFAFIDPHGKSASLILDYIPPERIKDVIYFAPFDMDNPIAFNVMEDVGPDKRHLVANGLMSAFKKIWGPETWSARMEYILGNVLLALLEYPDATLLSVNRMLTDKAYRKKVVDNVKDPSVKAYWVDEFAKYTETYTKDATPAIQNKIGQFTANPLLRNIVGQPKSSFDLRKIMDERKILIVNLSKGQLGEGNANLLGGMIITKLYLAAMSRADLTEGELKKLPNFSMYVDEFQSFANESFADILSEARKYKLSLVIAHQYIKQMDEKVADAVFGNVGTQIMFRVGAPDAEFLEKEYAPVFTMEDMVGLGKYQIYLKLMIDGVASHPFSALTLPAILPPKKSSREEVIASSRKLYAHPREEVGKTIADWYGPDQVPAPAPRVEKTEQAPSKDFKPTISSGEISRPTNVPVVPPLTPKPAGEVRKFETSKPEKKFEKPLEKPFAQAFKDLGVAPKAPNPPPSPKAPAKVSEGVSLNVLTSQKPKGPSEANMGNLKSALADVLKEQPKARTESQPRPAPRPSPQAEEVPQKELPPKVEQKVFEETKKESSEKKHEEPRPPREVPEDVLTAILRGDE